MKFVTKVPNPAYFAVILIVILAVGAASPKVLKPIEPAISNTQLQGAKPIPETANNYSLNTNEIYEIIDSKINSTFSHTINLINLLLFVLTLFITGIAVYTWLISRGIITGILAEIKKQVEEEVKIQLKQEVEKEIIESINEIQKKLNSDRMELEKLSNEQKARIASIEEFAKQQRDKLASEFASEISRLKSLISSNDFVNQGNYYFVSSSFDNALSCYEKAIEIEANYPEAWFYKGRALSVGQRRYEEAIVAYKQALKLKPEYYEAMVFCSVALQKLKRYEESIALCDKAIKINASFAKAWYTRAESYALLGNIEQAIKNLERAIQLSPDRYRDIAKTEPDFELIRDNEEFRGLVFGDEKKE